MIGFQGKKRLYECLLGIAVLGAIMPIQHQQFTAYEGVTSGPQVMLAYEIQPPGPSRNVQKELRDWSPVSSPGLEVGS